MASTVFLPPRHYLNDGYGIRSWLLTRDHKRIALLYLAAVTFFFFVGGSFAVVIRLDLATPAGDLVSDETYNKLFTMHGVMMVFFFLVPVIPAVLGNFLLPIMIGATLQHVGGGWLFTNQGGGWEFPVFWTVAVVVQSLLGDGIYALRWPRAEHAVGKLTGAYSR